MSILKDSSKYFVGELSSKSIPFLLLPYMAHKMLVEDIANYAIYQSVLAFLSAILVFSMDGAIARFYYIYGKRSINTLRATAIKIIIAFSSFVLILSFLSSNVSWAIVALTSAAYAVYMINLSVAQSSKQVNIYIRAQLITSIALVIFVVILFETIEANANYRIWASCIAWIIASVYLYKYTFVTKRVSHNVLHRKNFVKYFIGFGLPLVLHNLSGLIKGHVDRFIINSSYQAEELAQYFFALQIASAFYLVLLAVNRGAVPHLFENLKKDIWTVHDINRFVILSLFFIPIVPIVLSLIPQSLYSFIFGVEYVVLKNWVPLMVLGYCVLIPYFILVNYLFYKAQNKLISTISVVASVLHILVVMYLADISMNWVVVSMAISSTIQVLLLYCFFYWKYLRR